MVGSILLAPMETASKYSSSTQLRVPQNSSSKEVIIRFVASLGWMTIQVSSLQAKTLVYKFGLYILVVKVISALMKPRIRHQLTSLRAKVFVLVHFQLHAQTLPRILFSMQLVLALIVQFAKWFALKKTKTLSSLKSVTRKTFLTLKFCAHINGG